VLGASETLSGSLDTLGTSEVARRLDSVRAIGHAGDVHDLRAALAREAGRDPWFDAALASFDLGSPTSLHVAFEHFRRGRGRSLHETLAADLQLARAFVRRHDFPEGVRAALIDKDRRPAWAPPTLDDVPHSAVAAYFGG